MRERRPAPESPKAERLLPFVERPVAAWQELGSFRNSASRHVLTMLPSETATGPANPRPVHGPIRIAAHPIAFPTFKTRFGCGRPERRDRGAGRPVSPSRRYPAVAAILI